MRPLSRFYNPAIALAGLLALAALAGAPGRAAARNGSPSDMAPGFGLVYGEGKTEHGGETVRAGFSSRRLKDDNRIGSLALLAEQHVDGLRYQTTDPSLGQDDVSLRYQSIYMEMKRYFPYTDYLHYYWGVRGGYSRVTGEVTSGGKTRDFRADQVAPLALLALPLMFEHPGFLILALLDGTSAGMTLDIVPGRIWLDFQVSVVMLPRYRDEALALEELTLVTQTLQLAIVF